LGGYPDLNRELTVPHTVVLPIELYLPYYSNSLKCESILYYYIMLE
jgi:hypothetical protein